MLDFKTIVVGKSAVINISIPCGNLDHNLLYVLKNPHACKQPEHYSHKELTCAAYALFELMDSKLSNSLIEEFKNKFSSSSCETQNGNFIITINTPSNFSIVRKNLATVCKMLDPHKAFQPYKKYMAELGKPANKEHFVYAANQLSKALKDAKVFICASFKIDGDKKKQLEDRIKLIPSTQDKGESKPPTENIKNEERAHLKFSNQFEAFMGHKFLKFMKADCHLLDKQVYLTGFKGDLKVLQSKYKDSWKHYVERLQSQKEKLNDIIMLSAAQDGLLTASDLGGITDAKTSKTALIKIW